MSVKVNEQTVNIPVLSSTKIKNRLLIAILVTTLGISFNDIRQHLNSKHYKDRLQLSSKNVNPETGELTTDTILRLEDNYLPLTWTPIALSALWLALMEIRGMRKAKKIIAERRELLDGMALREEHLRKHDFEDDDSDDIDTGIVKSVMFGMLMIYKTSNTPAEFANALKTLIRIENDQFRRLLFSTFLLTFTLNLNADPFAGGIRPFSMIRQYMPRQYFNRVGTTDVGDSLSAITEYLKRDLQQKLERLLRQLNPGLEVDQSAETVFEDFGTAPIAGVEAFNISPDGYYAWYVNNEKYPQDTSYELYSKENYEQFLRHTDTSEQGNARRVKITDLSLSPGFFQSYDNGIFFPLLTRLETREGEDSFSYPFLPTDIKLELHFLNKRKNKVLPEDEYTILADPRGYVGIFIPREIFTQMDELTVSYTLREVQDSTDLDTYTVKFNEEAEIMNKIADNERFKKLKELFPNGIIEITDADLKEAGLNPATIPTIDVITEILGVSFYDIVTSPDYQARFDEFITSINSDDLVELYCTSAAQVANMFDAILSPDSPFILIINNKVVPRRQQGDSRQLLMANGYLAKGTNKTIYEIWAHAYNILSERTQDGKIIYRVTDLTPARISPNTNPATNALLRALDEVRAKDTKTQKVTGTASDDTKEKPSQSNELPIILIAVLLGGVVINKIRKSLSEKQKDYFTAKYENRNDSYVYLAKFIKGFISKNLFGDPQKITVAETENNLQKTPQIISTDTKDEFRDDIVVADLLSSIVDDITIAVHYGQQEIKTFRTILRKKLTDYLEQLLKLTSGDLANLTFSDASKIPSLVVSFQKDEVIQVFDDILNAVEERMSI